MKKLITILLLFISIAGFAQADLNGRIPRRQIYPADTTSESIDKPIWEAYIYRISQGAVDLSLYYTKTESDGRYLQSLPSNVAYTDVDNNFVTQTISRVNYDADNYIATAPSYFQIVSDDNMKLWSDGGFIRMQNYAEDEYFSFNSSSGDATLTGDLSAANLSGTNTGDQDLTGYYTKTETAALPVSTFTNDVPYLTSYSETDPIWTADKSNYVTLSGTETITGAKTFTSDATITRDSPRLIVSNTNASSTYGVVLFQDENGIGVFEAGYNNSTDEAFFWTPSADVKIGAGGSERFRLDATDGQAKLNAYTSSSSFPITPVGMLVYDASGNVGTQAIPSGGGTVTSVAITGSDFDITGSPIISSGTIAMSIADDAVGSDQIEDGALSVILLRNESTGIAYLANDAEGIFTAGGSGTTAIRLPSTLITGKTFRIVNWDNSAVPFQTNGGSSISYANTDGSTTSSTFPANSVTMIYYNGVNWLKINN